jgi:hypothetical protein
MSVACWNPNRAHLCLTLVVTLLCAWPNSGQASDQGIANDDWTFVFAPYAWLLSVDGDASYRGNDAEIDQSFGDIFSQLDVVLEGRFEARKGRWTLFLDPTISRLSDDAEIGPIDVGIDTTLALVGFGVSRTLYSGPRSPGSSRSLILETGLGGVLTHARSEIDLPSPASDPELKETWFDAALSVRGPPRSMTSGGCAAASSLADLALEIRRSRLLASNCSLAGVSPRRESYGSVTAPCPSTSSAAAVQTSATSNW